MIQICKHQLEFKYFKIVRREHRGVRITQNFPEYLVPITPSPHCCRGMILHRLKLLSYAQQ